MRRRAGSAACTRRRTAGSLPQVPEEVREREAGVDEVLHDDDVATGDVDVEVLEDPDAARVRGVPRDREEVDGDVDSVMARTRSARKISAPLSTPTSTTPSGWSRVIRPASALDVRLELARSSSTSTAVLAWSGSLRSLAERVAQA